MFVDCLCPIGLPSGTMTDADVAEAMQKEVGRIGQVYVRNGIGTTDSEIRARIAAGDCALEIQLGREERARAYEASMSRMIDTARQGAEPGENGEIVGWTEGDW